MYETSRVLTRLDRTLQPLWRYMTGSRLLDLLRTKELFFSHLPVLEDQLEGALTARTQEYLANWFQSQNQCARSVAYAEVSKYQENRENFYVNCWHMNDHESYLMWKAYASRGFAIKTSFERLVAALCSESPAVTGGKVEYVDYQRDATMVGNVFNHVAVKDRPYQDEREFRLVFWDLDPRNAAHPRVQGGVRVPVDTRLLIQAVIRSPYEEPMDSELEAALEHLNIRFESSRVFARPR